MKKRGISVRKLNYVATLLLILLSVFLLLATYRISGQYTMMKENTDNLITLQQAAYDLQTGSDVLTEQVRCFAETGDLYYLNGYFTEANETKRRDNALLTLQKYKDKTDAYQELEKAMEQSVHLMTTEYYSMRLTAEAFGHDLKSLPPEIQAVVLDKEDAGLDAAGKEKKARTLVFNAAYHNEKAQITSHMQNCLKELNEDIEGVQIETAEHMNLFLEQQSILIIAMIVIAGLSMAASLFLVIRPLIRAVGFINNEEPLPVNGSSEFRILARSYNMMFDSYLEQNRQLAYDQSHDSLTGLYNRAGFEFLSRRIDPETSAILKFDIDNFRSYNEEFGHKTGDRVLCVVGKEIQRSFRSQDHVCRIEGDEFIVVLEQVNDSARDMIREKVALINRRLSALRNNLPPLSISCGAVLGTEFTDITSMVNTADNALYEVKERGGNGCEIR